MWHFFWVTLYNQIHFKDGSDKQYILQPQSTNWERKKDIMRVVNSSKFYSPPVSINHRALAGQTSAPLSRENEGRETSYISYGQRGSQCIAKRFFPFLQLTAQVTSLKPAFKIDLSLLRLHLCRANRAPDSWAWLLVGRDPIYLEVDHNDPSKPSHRWTNGPELSKTIESDGSNIKKPS